MNVDLTFHFVSWYFRLLFFKFLNSNFESGQKCYEKYEKVKGPLHFCCFSKTKDVDTLPQFPFSVLIIKQKN